MEIHYTTTPLLKAEEPSEVWTCPTESFSCQPEDIRFYVESERWDLVFNALCYLAGIVDEGRA